MLVYASAPSRAGSLLWVDRRGTAGLIADLKRDIRYPRLSPDGEDVALVIHERPPDHQADLWLYNLSREILTRMTVGRHYLLPLWDPNGKSITVTRYGRPDEGAAVFRVLADGSSEPELLFEHGAFGAAEAWTSDGQTLFLEEGNGLQADISTFSLGDSEVRPFLHETFDEALPKLSPDGRWLAYVSNESGGDEVYVRAISQSGRKAQVSNRGGTEPVWNRSGHELFYVNKSQMLAVAIETDPELRVGRPQLLFEFEGDYDEGYDVDPTGSSFLMVRRQSAGDQDRVHVVVNWFQELKRLVPTN